MKNTLKMYGASALVGSLGIRVARALVLTGFCLAGSICAQESSDASSRNSKAKLIEKVTPTTKRDIYQTSDVLTDGQFHTVVPKGAILSVPESLLNRMASGPAGQFQFWPDFYARNKSWIRLQEVEVDVAKGKAPLPEAVVKMMGTETKMVIASYKGTIVSVLEAPPKDDTAEKTKEKK